MIIEQMFTIFGSFLKVIFGWISLPQMPNEINAILSSFFVSIESGVGFLFIVFNMTLVRILLPLVLAVVNFERIYRTVMFILRKFPFLGIS